MLPADLKSRTLLILGQTVGLVTIRRSGHFNTLSLVEYGNPFDPTLLVSLESENRAENEQLELLRILYSSAPDDLRHDFWQTVTGNAPIQAGNVVGHLIVELQRLDVLPRLKTSNPTDTEAAFLRLVWHALRSKLSLQSVMFSDLDLETLATASVIDHRILTAGGVRISHRPLAAELTATLLTIRRLQYLRLKDQLLQVENPEINTDRRTLVSRLEQLGFSGTLTSAINEVEKKIRAAATELDFRGCMDLLRVIFEETFEESSKRIEKQVGKPAPDGAGNFQPFKQYLENAGLLTPHESDVCQKLYNYLSQAGSHSLMSAPEQLRVSKNTVVEWSLLLVGRVQEYVEIPPNASPSVA